MLRTILDFIGSRRETLSFNAEEREGKRRGAQRVLEVVGDTFDAFFEVEDVKVD